MQSGFPLLATARIPVDLRGLLLSQLFPMTLMVLFGACCAVGMAQEPLQGPRRMPRINAQPSESVKPIRDRRTNLHHPFDQEDPVRQVVAEGELIPIRVPETPSNVELSTNNELVNLVATGAAVDSVLRMISDHHGMNLVIGPDVTGPITISIRGVRLEEVLDAICGVLGFKWHRQGNLLYVTGMNATGIDPSVQGSYLRTYSLDYIAAKDVESVANGLISSVGKVYINEAAPNDNLRTREMLIVEDVLAAHTRIEQYLAQSDVAPKQVLVEAHVLQIALGDEDRHGINLETIARFGGSNIRLTGSGLASENASGPSVALRIDGTDMDSLIEMIQKHTDSRTLASPKISVVNHQEAKIQIGQRLPYSVSTTTQTATVQDVQFLEVGIVLTVRPIITSDGNVLMTVLPKVSGGKIGENGFPQEDTTEVSTTVLIPDGGGLVIGGLIREENSDNKAMIPYVGKVPVLGNLFKRRSRESRRNELVVALVTRVMHVCSAPRQQEIDDLHNTLPMHAVQGMLESPLQVVESIPDIDLFHSATSQPLMDLE